MTLLRYVALLSLFSLCGLTMRSSLAEDQQIARGRYLSIIGGCNDCHTAGYAESGGTLAEGEWLKGVPVGWRGPWGTSYAINLRLVAANTSADGWVQFLKNSKARPPMPSYMFRTMSEEDMRALYAFIKSLGPDKTVIPAGLPPGEEPKGPYFNFVPVSPISKE